jgi:uncharacterized protein (TIGR01777 family)
MKVLVTGSTGLVGTALVASLAREGHTVCRLMRPGAIEKDMADSRGGAGGFAVSWNPATGELGGAAVGPDAVVNLAGAPIGDGRWSPKRKEIIRSSRIDTTRALVNALAKMNVRPSVLVSASAIGIYGNRGDEILSEESTSGSDFLAEIAREWEVEAMKAEAIGIRVVLARFGIILAKHAGALQQMMTPFKFGVGGKLGSGQQWTSWVALEDVIQILRFAIETNSVRGPINVTSPNPVRNAEFTKILSTAMHRPAIFPAPAFALRLALGEMADALLLSSQRVIPQKLQQLNYEFLCPDLAGTLATLLGGPSN